MMLARKMWPQNKNAGDQTLRLLFRAMAPDEIHWINFASHPDIVYERHAAS